jgi:hypothetical protein
MELGGGKSPTTQLRLQELSYTNPTPTNHNSID